MGRAPAPYQRQTGASAPAGVSYASPGDFGAGVGAAIGGLGDSLIESELRATRLQRAQTADQERADFAKRFAAARLDLGTRRAEARATAGPGAAGHAKAIEAAAGELDKLADGLTDDGDRRHAQQQIEEYRSGLIEGERAFEIAKGAVKTASDTEEAVRDMTAAVRTGAGSYADNTRGALDLIDGLTNVSDETRVALRQGALRALALANIDRGNDVNPAATRLELSLGAYNDVLSGEEIGRAMAQSDALATAKARTERAAADLARQERLQGYRADRAKLSEGAGTYQDRLALADRFEADGDATAAVEMRQDARQFAAAQSARGLPPTQIEQEIAKLDAKAELSPEDADRRKGLQKELAQANARLDRGGGAMEQAAYASRRTIPEIDPSHPATFRARGEFAKAAAASVNRADIEPFRESELDGLKDLVDGTPAQRLQALQTILLFDDPRVMLGAAKQISGKDDGAFRIALTHARRPGGVSVAKAILSGKAALDANPQLWNQREADTVFNRYYARALAAAPAEYASDVRDAVQAFYVERARLGNASKFSPGHYAAAIETILGSVARTGKGLVVVPPGEKADRLLTSLARASREDVVGAQSAPPRWSDGSKSTLSQVKQMLPVWAGGTRYAFRAADGRFLLDAAGGHYTVDLGRLPRR